MKAPETRYAMSGDVSIAYQVAGDGPFDVVLVPGSPSTIEFFWRYEFTARWLARLASFCRLIVFDKRGTGLSDRAVGVADLETRMDDVRAVMDAAGSARAGLIGLSEGGPMSVLFAASYPEKVKALVLYEALPRLTLSPDFPFGMTTREEWLRAADKEARLWGTAEQAREWLGPQASADEMEQMTTLMRLSASPGAWRALNEMMADIDVRGVLASIRVPTLVLHRTEDHIPIEGARWMAERIPGARFVEHPGGPHAPPMGDWQLWCDEIERFLVPLCTAPEPAPEPDLMLATVLFTDIVDSTVKAVELGDRGWRELLERHHSLVRTQLARFRGSEVDTAGDGFFASFDGPARAIRCARSISEGMSEIGLDVRAGLHTGECELLEGKVAGIAVVIGARVAAQAGPGEVLVSQTVKDLVAGSGIEFADRGLAELKGVPGEWRLYAVADA
jgi:pimeloyl-ACP methyl ester carboxylesterase/class 3 adenylate cyclase